jgi:hypothetical protein
MYGLCLPTLGGCGFPRENKKKEHSSFIKSFLRDVNTQKIK